LTHDTRVRLHAILDATRVPIDAHCRPLLDALVELGLQRMDADDVDAERRGEAEDQLRVLLGDMTQQVRILRLDALCEPTLASALARLCPLWPYC